MLLGLPLLGTGACVQIVQDAVIEGFFNAATPLLVDRAEERLALDETSTAGQDAP